MSNQRPLCHKCFPPTRPNDDALVNAFENVMDLVDSESPNTKRVAKLFKKQLIELLVEKEMLQVKLQNKNREFNQLQMQYTDKEEHYHRLEQHKKDLERHLEMEVMNFYHLSREFEDLKLAKKKLQIYIDHLQLEER